MKKAIKIIILLLFAITWMLIIFKLSGMTSNTSNGKSTNIISIFIEDALDITNEYGITSSYPTDEKLDRASTLINAPMRKVIHASVYFVLAFFIMTFLNVIFDHKKYLLTIILAFIICVLFASSDEIHQTFVNGRTGQILDVIIDSAGAIVGIFFYSTYHIVYKAGLKQGMKSRTNIVEENFIEDK